MWLLYFALVTSAFAELQQVTAPIEHGEGPHWSVQEQALYWVDITKRDVWRYHPESGNVTTCHIDQGDVTVIVPIKDKTGEFAVGVGDKLVLLKWDGLNDTRIELDEIASFAPLPDGGRLNDGKADADNRLWIGTIGPETNNKVVEGLADFYKIICDNGKIQPIIQVRNVTVSNGIAWTADGRTMYYVDSPTRKIDAFNFHPEDGTITNRGTMFDFDLYNISGVPDGMTIDKDDNLWVAMFLGEVVVHLNPAESRLIKTYPIPGASQVTSVSWGGPRLDELYITTSSRGGVTGGELYRLTETGTSGYPANDFAIPICDMKDCKK